MTLQDFESRASEVISQPLPERVEIDELDNTITADEWRAEQLALLSREIRRCAWQGDAAQQQACQLAARCDKAAAHFGGSGLPLPRFDTCYSGGILHRAIQ
jgi:hypothetical protein